MIDALKISLCIVAVYECTQEGMILHRARAWAATQMDRRLGDARSEWLQKPLWGCLICMSSIWGLIFSVAFEVALIDVPLTILMVCGVNSLINRVIINLLRNENDSQSIK